MPGFDPLAAHTIDIHFLFPLWHAGELGVPHPLNDAETKLSNELVAAWTNFAASGNPNGSGDTPWNRYVVATAPTTPRTSRDRRRFPRSSSRPSTTATLGRHPALRGSGRSLT
jgi:carboxylesterase type B